MSNEDGKKPSVVIIEDQKSWSRMLPELIGEYPSIVLATYEEAMQFLDDQDKLDDLERMLVTAFIVDGNLSKDVSDGSEGTQIVARIRESKYSGSIVISNSGSHALEGVDFDLGKKLDRIENLPGWINSASE